MGVAIGVIAGIALLAWLVVYGRGSNAQSAGAAGQQSPSEPEDLTQATMGGVVLLRDNDWSQCTFDGLSADWSSMTSGSVRGFHSVHSGRHQACVDGYDGPATHDFVLYPGEIYIRKLQGQAFVEDEPDTHERYRQLAWGGAIGSMSRALVNFMMCRVSAGETPERSPERIASAVASLAQLLEDCGGAPQPADIEKAIKIGLDLMGVVMVRKDLSQLTSLVDMRASLSAMKGDFRAAASIATLGLGVLPGDPFLLDLLANLLSDGGAPEEGLKKVEEALRRPDALGPAGVAKAQATRTEIVAKLQ